MFKPKFASGSLKSSVGNVQRLATRLAAQNRTVLDICFCFDATGSMSGWINQVKRNIVQIAKDITGSDGMAARFALVVYRDYCDGTNRVQQWGFQTPETLGITLQNVSANGGGDGPENCFGGLWAAASQVNWEAPSRVIIWIGDSPEHGSRYHDGSDFYPKGDPQGMTSARIFAELKKKHIRLLFCKLTSYTDKMIKVLLEEAIPYGPDRLVTYQVLGDMRTFLRTNLTTALSMSAINENINLGPPKTFQLTPATFHVDSLWKPIEVAKVSTLQSYRINKVSSLGELFNSENPVSEDAPRTIQLQTTINPVDKGVLRLVYLTLVNEQKYVIKESKYDGELNTRKGLYNQACVQTVAAALAKEFTAQVQKTNTGTSLEYVPVDVVQLTGRQSGKEWVSMEPYIEGQFVKFCNNSGQVNMQLNALHPMASAFAHFTYCSTSGVLMVTDLQGVAVSKGVYTLTDPSIHTADPANYLPHPTNLGTKGITGFFQSHQCNHVCKALQLVPPEQMKLREIVEDDEEDDEIDEVVVLKNEPFSPAVSSETSTSLGYTPCTDTQYTGTPCTDTPYPLEVCKEVETREERDTGKSKCWACEIF